MRRMICKNCEGYDTAFGCGLFKCNNILSKRLAAYADAEEQGLLVRLPCKTGDTLFVASQGTILSGTVDKITVSERDVYVFSKHDSADWVFTPANFGRIVFLSREEAEAALKGGEDYDD